MLAADVPQAIHVLCVRWTDAYRGYRSLSEPAAAGSLIHTRFKLRQSLRKPNRNSHTPVSDL